MSPVRAIVKPELLRWARNSAGYTLPDVASKLGLASERMERWETGEDSPTIGQLRELSRVYKRPLAVFYLPRPPIDFKPIQDFRRLPGVVRETNSPELIFEMRTAHDRREAALELFQALEMDPPAFALIDDISTLPESLAAKIRSSTGITEFEQFGWRSDEYAGFNAWRKSVEGMGVLVFQATEVEDTSEMRGFSITDMPLPAIVVNSKDGPTARNFTLMHELCHIVLRQGGLCDLQEEGDRPPERQKLEVYCNRVAGAVLVPSDSLLRDERVKQRASDDSDLADIDRLASRYSVSPDVILRRLLILDRLSKMAYQESVDKLEERRARFSRPGDPGFVHPANKAFSRAGPFFSRLALESYRQDRITDSELSDLLEVRLKHLPKIEASARDVRK